MVPSGLMSTEIHEPSFVVKRDLAGGFEGEGLGGEGVGLRGGVLGVGGGLTEEGGAGEDEDGGGRESRSLLWTSLHSAPFWNRRRRDPFEPRGTVSKPAWEKW